MLKKRTVEEKTFELLKRICNDENFNNFFLVGGTSIALQIGHRKSIDLDLFTQEDIKVQELLLYLKSNYNFQQRYLAKNTLKGEINGIFVYFIKYGYPLLKPLIIEDDVRLVSLEDVCCMKLSAITDNGSRVKDFVDIAYLSTKFSLSQMLDFYKQKFNEENLISPAKALLYFEDIDFSKEKVELFDVKFNWEKIENRLIEMSKTPNKVFPTVPIQKNRTYDIER